MYNNAFYISGKYAKYQQVGDTLYFEKDYGTDRHAVVNKIMTWVWIGAVLGFFAALFRVIFQNRQ